MYSIRYRKLAEEDLVSIFDTITKDSPTVALEYIDKLEENIDLLTSNPLLGVECKRKNINRACRVLIFEVYLIFYEVLESEIVIIRILSSRQDYSKKMIIK